MSNDPTKAKLIDAAGEEFAAKGFEGATVRSIARRAGVNIAGINYHFGDKERLYEAAVIEAHRAGMVEASEDDDEAGPPEETIRAFIRRFLGGIVRGGDGGWQRALMLREIIQPSGASDVLVRETIRPRFDRLIAAFRAICPDAEERRLHAMAFSLVGQCLHYKVACPISVRLIGEPAYGRLDLDYLTDHIATVCLASIGVVSPFVEARPPARMEGRP